MSRESPLHREDVTRKSDLPEPFDGAPFSVSAALASGITAERLRGRDLFSPFYGVRMPDPPSTVVELCTALRVRMREGDVFSHLTAAALWGMPLGLHAADPRLHVTSPAPSRALRGRGILGHSERLTMAEVTVLHSLPVVTPARAWAQAAALLPWWDSVALGDFIVTGLPLADRLPLATFDELVEAHRMSSRRGAARRRCALEHIAPGPFSRPESLSKVLFRLGKLPDARLNEPVVDDRGSFLAMPDEVWPEYKVAYEYEGDHHREKDRYRRDLARVEALVDHGWIVVKASAEDLFDRPGALLERVARRLRSRGWRGSPRDLPQSVLFRR